MEKSWKTFEETVLGMEKLGGVCIPHYCFSSLAAFMHGYATSLNNSQEGNPLEGFREWLCVKFNTQNSLAWSYLILFLHEESQEKALVAFYPLFREFVKFRSEKGIEFILEENKRLIESRIKAAQ